MSISLAAFLVLGAVAAITGLGVVFSRNVVHAALFLVGSLVAVAGLYILLFAEFLALVQILIYGGAVVILLLFALMLTRSQEYPLGLDNPQKPWAIVAGLAFFGVLGYAVFGTRWGTQAGAPASGGPVPLSFEGLGQSLFSQWAVPFEVASLVLLVALIGAIVIARREESE